MSNRTMRRDSRSHPVPFMQPVETEHLLRGYVASGAYSKAALVANTLHRLAAARAARQSADAAATEALNLKLRASGSQRRSFDAHSGRGADSNHDTDSHMDAHNSDNDDDISSSSESTAITAEWRRHEAAWAAFVASTAPGATPPQRITFDSLPWPPNHCQLLSMSARLEAERQRQYSTPGASGSGPQQQQSLPQQNQGAAGCSSSRSSSAKHQRTYQASGSSSSGNGRVRVDWQRAYKVAYKTAQLRWHPDKLMARCAGRIDDEAEAKRITAELLRISQSLNEQWTAHLSASAQ